MIVSDCCTPDVIWTAPSHLIDEAITLMENFSIHHLPVVQNDRIVGMVSDRDILLSVGWKLSCERRLSSPGVIAGPRTIEEIMSRPVYTLPVDTPLHDVTELMADKKISAVPLLCDGHLVALVTQSDVLRRMQSSEDESFSTQRFLNLPVYKLMTKKVFSVRPKSSWVDAMDLFRAKRIRHLPVVVQDELVGIISDRDCRRALGESLIHDAQAQIQGQSYTGPEYVMDIMTSDVLTVSPWDPLNVAIDAMLVCNIHSLVVLHKMKLRGIITETDLIRAIGNQSFAMV